MKKIIWTDVATADLAKIHSYISQDSQTYADTLILDVFIAVEKVLLFPRSGRVVPEFKKVDTREVFVGNYRIMYDIKGSVIRILTILHGARLLK